MAIAACIMFIFAAFLTICGASLVVEGFKEEMERFMPCFMTGALFIWTAIMLILMAIPLH